MLLPRALILAVVLMGTLLPAAAHAQFRQTTALFLDHHPQPRVHALGEATTALDGYSGAIGINPAGIGEPGVIRAGTNGSLDPLLGSSWLPSLFEESVWIAAPSLSIRAGRLAGAAQVIYFAREAVAPPFRRGSDSDEIDQFGWAATVAGAYDLTPTLTAGAALRLVRQQLADVSAEHPLTSTTPALDVGLQYDRRYPRRRVTVRPMLGWSVTNVGPTVDFGGDVPGDRALPTKMRLGAAVDVASAVFSQDRPLLRLVLAGALTQPLTNFETETRTLDSGETAAYLDADGPFKALFSSGWAPRPGAVQRDGSTPELSVWEQTTRHLGAELQVREVLSLQWGRFHEDEQAGGRQFTTLGVGVDLYYATLQHSWTVGEGPLDNSFWRLSVRIPLSGNAPDAWGPLGE